MVQWCEHMEISPETRVCDCVCCCVRVCRECHILCVCICRCVCALCARMCVTLFEHADRFYMNVSHKHAPVIQSINLLINQQLHLCYLVHGG